MSKTTDYLVSVLAEKDSIIQALRSAQGPDNATAWAQGWSALAAQYAAQQHDPSHPITSNNPYTIERPQSA